MNRQRRLLSRAAVRVIYQAGIIEARGDEWSAWPLAPPDNGPTRPPRPETPCYLACFSHRPLEPLRRVRKGIKASGQRVLKVPCSCKIHFACTFFRIMLSFKKKMRKKEKQLGKT